VAEVTFVSSNPGKWPEVRDVLASYGVTSRWQRRTLPEPQAETLAEVVRSKLEAAGAGPSYRLIEDSGLFIPSLGGFPGVYSAHFLKIWGFGPIFELLRHRDRTAYFQAVAGLRHGSKRWTFTGEVHGRIAARPSGTNGFGYDPIFVPTGWRRTFADGPIEEKNRISHRARAIQKVGEFLSHERRERRPR
jgi:XTP/dITP diphosphohydrolase